MTARVSIQTGDFDVAQEIAALRAGDRRVGAVCTFVGTVRERNDGAAVSSMELEHYPGMTEAAIEAMIDEAHRRFDIHAARVIHRVGLLQPLDQIVLVAVTSAHRGERLQVAFEEGEPDTLDHGLEQQALDQALGEGCRHEAAGDCLAGIVGIDEDRLCHAGDADEAYEVGFGDGAAERPAHPSGRKLFPGGALAEDGQGFEQADHARTLSTKPRLLSGAAARALPSARACADAVPCARRSRRSSAVQSCRSNSAVAPMAP